MGYNAALIYKKLLFMSLLYEDEHGTFTKNHLHIGDVCYDAIQDYNESNAIIEAIFSHQGNDDKFYAFIVVKWFEETNQIKLAHGAEKNPAEIIGDILYNISPCQVLWDLWMHGTSLSTVKYEYGCVNSSDLGRGFQWKFRNLDLGGNTTSTESGDFIKANLNYKVIKITDNDNVILVEETKNDKEMNAYGDVKWLHEEKGREET
ncbi:hypothetical protein RhiirA4_450521 [Rhizophagus irregularis]|uniref:Uncharacterized protein n=1 Tax=Rhizophagus irregularis TaxID=588596 RepID=A0A2I1FTD9_9GLOM|nr:hypothetical protein RhiirA4_450521 [Rhizophagus irregularis]